MDGTARRKEQATMPRLIIDGMPIEVTAGTRVIDAAEKLGIMIPRFCYHEGLGAVGACRMCAVKFLQGPLKGVQMSCMVEAQDGMVVSTTDDEAVAFRKQMIEWLMLNHPHDCPVCDEGGQCLLQDETISGGHSRRRFLGKKRTYNDQYLGELIAHEMNRCIHCYRCSRFYQEYAGYRDFGVLQIANRVYFGRFRDGPLESPFSGNLVDICPTGVYTDKPARFMVRRWDLQRAPSVCVHCSLGCNTVANARYRDVVRVEARFNEKVNGYFICDRGRFGFSYTNEDIRPRVARAEAGPIPLGRAIRLAAESLKRVALEHGPGAVACLGSARSSLETQTVLNRLCSLQKWGEPNFFVNRGIREKVKSVVSLLDEGIAISVRELEGSDCVLAVGVDPVNEAPMLALAMRQVGRREGMIAVMDPRPVFLPCGFAHLPISTAQMDGFLSGIVSASVRSRDENERRDRVAKLCDGLGITDGEFRDRAFSVAQSLSGSLNPAIVCGTEVVRQSTPHTAISMARLLRQTKGRGGFLAVLPGANAFGAGLLSSRQGTPFEDVLQSIESGQVKALMVVENDPIGEFTDRNGLLAALDKLEFLLVLDSVASPTVRRAHVFLPTTTCFETGSSFINHEGRLQYAEAVHHGGIPVRQVNAGNHPPRVYGSDIPGGGPGAAWILLIELGGALGVTDGDMLGAGPWAPIGDGIPALRKLELAGFPSDGVRVLPEELAAMAGGESEDPEEVEPRPPVVSDPEADTLELLLVEWTLGTEELSSRAPALQRAEMDPCVFMHVEDAARAGFCHGQRIALSSDSGTVEVELCTRENMARGTLVLPRHRRLEWRKFAGLANRLRADQAGSVPGT